MILAVRMEFERLRLPHVLVEDETLVRDPAGIKLRVLDDPGDPDAGERARQPLPAPIGARVGRMGPALPAALLVGAHGPTTAPSGRRSQDFDLLSGCRY
jgi:hypothetical protein